MRSEVRHLNDLNPVAAAIARLCNTHPVCLFYGNMGAGKTTLITRICKYLQAEGNLSSPTFTLVNEYRMSNGDPVYHIDLYRVNSILEALDAGIEEYLYSGCICLVEWPELIAERTDGPRMEVHITLQDDNSRLIEVIQIS